MIIVELTEDKFGQAMKDINCMEEKLEGLKHIFEAESMGYRKKGYMDREYDRDYDRRYDRESREHNYGNRYI